MGNENTNQPNYEEELVEVIKSGASDERIREELDNYHENDIAGALELLNVEERKRLYRILGIERVSEIFAYLDDVGRYIEELELERS